MSRRATNAYVHDAPGDLAQDAALRLPRGGIDQHVADEVDVDRVRWPAIEQEDVVGELLHLSGPLVDGHVRDCSQEKPRTAK